MQGSTNVKFKNHTCILIPVNVSRTDTRRPKQKMFCVNTYHNSEFENGRRFKTQWHTNREQILSTISELQIT
jgi:hypothetical protein